MTTWAQYKAQIQRTVLKDITTVKFSDEQLMDSFNWSALELVQHTALASQVDYAATGLEYPVPEDFYENVEISGMLALTDSSGSKTYLDPVRRTNNVPFDSNFGFYVVGNTICLGGQPADGSTLTVYYFAYYPPITSDSDILTIPRFAEGAFSYLVGSYALLSKGTTSADLRQWAVEPEKGQPENNSLRIQSNWMRKMYFDIIDGHMRQDRANQYRNLNG